MMNILRALCGPRGPKEPNPLAGRVAELLAEVERLRNEVAELGQRNEQLAAENEQLRQQVAELVRAGKRQATPFARRQRTAAPKPPGRRAGEGAFTHRPPPAPEAVAETKTVRLPCCPQCGGEVTDCQEHEQFMVEIPPVAPVIIRYVTESGYCAHCQQRVQSRHEEQISTARGAAGVVVGPRAKALATDLKHRLGLSYAKISDLMHTAFGLDVSRSAWCQADQRLARQARAVYEQLVERMRQSATVHSDETGWRIGAVAAWLWVFTNQEVTVYTIADNRSHEVVLTILGREFPGVLVSDCFTAYDHQALADWLKQKCLAHLLKDLSQMEAAKTRGAVRFARAVSTLLRQALALHQQKATLPAETYDQRCVELEADLDQLIDQRRRFTDPDNARFAKRLRKQRPHLLRFLYSDELDATNNQAERMLRPAVITRKTGGCNRTLTGAETHAILSSILVTCQQQAIPVLDFLVELQRRGQAPPVFHPP